MTPESLHDKQRLIAFTSGSGSTAEAIRNATTDGRLPRTELIAVVPSNEPSHQSLLQRGFAHELIVPVYRNLYKKRSEYGEALIKALRPLNPDVIGQYGHTPLTPANVINEFPVMINQHPGPVNPDAYDFGGEGMSNADRVHATRLYFVREAGRNFWTDVISQRVNVEFDQGKVLKRGRVEILPSDNPESLKKRALPVEWAVQIATLRDFEEGTVVELPPYDDLVFPGEREILYQAKRAAIRIFPH